MSATAISVPRASTAVCMLDHACARSDVVASAKSRELSPNVSSPGIVHETQALQRPHHCRVVTTTFSAPLAVRRQALLP